MNNAKWITRMNETDHDKLWKCQWMNTFWREITCVRTRHLTRQISVTTACYLREKYVLAAIWRIFDTNCSWSWHYLKDFHGLFKTTICHPYYGHITGTSSLQCRSGLVWRKLKFQTNALKTSSRRRLAISCCWNRGIVVAMEMKLVHWLSRILAQDGFFEFQ